MLRNSRALSKIGSMEELPPETSDGLWLTFFPVPKKGTNKMQGCVIFASPTAAFGTNISKWRVCILFSCSFAATT